MWSTSPQNFEFCKIIESIRKLYGPETVNSKISMSKISYCNMYCATIFQNLKLWVFSRCHTVTGRRIKASQPAKQCLWCRNAVKPKPCSTSSKYSEIFQVQWGGWTILNPLNPVGRLSGLLKQGAKNPAGRFSGIYSGVSKTWRASKPVHVRPIINWFVYTGRYQATHKSQVESSSLFNFRTICNLLTVFVLDARFCIENMAEILSVCEDADTRLMLWTM